MRTPITNITQPDINAYPIPVLSEEEKKELRADQESFFDRDDEVREERDHRINGE